MITSTLPFKKQQNIVQSHCSPTLTVLKKKVGQLKIDTAKLPMNEIYNWWDLDRPLSDEKNATNLDLFQSSV
jgi:hypothetical protein